MEIKTHPPMRVLYSTHQTTLSQLGQLAGVVVKELYAEAARNQVLVSGPCYWIYKGMDGQPETVFTLDIALPIQGSIRESSFATKDLPAFKAAVHVHESGWEKLGGAYAQVFQYVAHNHHQITGEFREVYLNIDMENPENNLTEVQVGILINGLQSGLPVHSTSELMGELL